MKATLSLEEIYAPVASALDEVREVADELWAEVLALLNDHQLPSLSTSGKLLRPAICLLAAGATGAAHIEKMVPLSVSIEMLHLAALAHDDVIDAAATRRGQRSLNAQWDNHIAVLGGDYLVARAMTLLGAYGSAPLLSMIVDTIRQMAEGELISFGKGVDRYSERDCLDLASRKTAALFAAACTGPTFLGDNVHRDRLRAFGLSLGMAFQLTDDILDLTQAEETLGKPACGDLVEGRRTLPIIYMRERLSDKDQLRLDSYQGAELTTQDRRWVADCLEKTGARSYTVEKARSFAETARNTLEALPPSLYRESLDNLADFVLIRTS